jgi:hypothetical protein
MKRQDVSLVGIIVDPFMGFVAPQSESSFSSTRCAADSSPSAFNSEKLCLLIFLLAFAFIAVASPILCFRSLFIKAQLEGLWYFWLITFFEIGYSVWFVLQRKVRK